MSDTKKCSKCGEVKGLGEFGGNTRQPDGHHYYCLCCKRESDSAWRRANLEKARESNRRSMSKLTAGERRAMHKRWRDANKDHVQAKTRESMARQRQKNPDKFISRKATWLVKNQEKVSSQEQSARDSLADNYVKKTLEKLGVNRSDATPELIALKREQLAIKRLSRELKKAIQPTKGNEK